MNKVGFGWAKRACALCVLCAAAAIASPAQTFTDLFNFAGSSGANPYAGVVQATDGNLYGTSAYGGDDGSFGTVFRMTAGGKLTTIYRFCSQSGCTDGATPEAGLIQASDGNFYGTTSSGGVYGAYGTVFKITSGGTLTALYSFDNIDGAQPVAPLAEGTDGNFYGTTELGGAYGGGTVFKISPAGAFMTLHSFDNTDGYAPVAGLIEASDGNFYGTTVYGGADVYYGTIFKITPSGTLTTLLSFDIGDGQNPRAGLIQAIDGNFYGTTTSGSTGYGTVFSITPAGTLTTLHSFDGTDGASPYAALVQGTDGNFYGTTPAGGPKGSEGTVFKITASGTLTTLQSFDGTDGASPYAALVQDTNGNFYGTSSVGGSNGDGTIFSLAVGLRPFVETLPTFGNAGTAVTILGTNLTGATSVSFNGTAAMFTVVSRSLITTTVPEGATSGRVEVTIPSGTLSSTTPFRVLP